MSRAGAERERPEATRSWRPPPFLAGSSFSGSVSSRALEAMDRMVVSSSGGLGGDASPHHSFSCWRLAAAFLRPWRNIEVGRAKVTIAAAAAEIVELATVARVLVATIWPSSLS